MMLTGLFYYWDCEFKQQQMIHNLVSIVRRERSFKLNLKSINKNINLPYENNSIVSTICPLGRLDLGYE